MSAQPSGNTSARQTESSAAESSEASADPGVAIESITAAELAKRVFACSDRGAYLAHVAQLIKREEEPALKYCFQELGEVAQSASIDLAAPHPPVRLAEPLGAFRTDAGVPAFPCATSGDIDTLSAVFSTLSALTRLHIATPANQKYAAFNGGRSHLVLQGRILEGVVVFEPNIGARGSFSHRQRHASADAARERVALALAEQAEGRTISLGADNVLVEVPIDRAAFLGTTHDAQVFSIDALDPLNNGLAYEQVWELWCEFPMAASQSSRTTCATKASSARMHPENGKHSGPLDAAHAQGQAAHGRPGLAALQARLEDRRQFCDYVASRKELLRGRHAERAAGPSTLPSFDEHWPLVMFEAQRRAQKGPTLLLLAHLQRQDTTPKFFTDEFASEDAFKARCDAAADEAALVVGTYFNFAGVAPAHLNGTSIAVAVASEFFPAENDPGVGGEPIPVTRGGVSFAADGVDYLRSPLSRLRVKAAAATAEVQEVLGATGRTAIYGVWGDDSETGACNVYAINTKPLPPDYSHGGGGDDCGMARFFAGHTSGGRDFRGHAIAYDASTTRSVPRDSVFLPASGSLEAALAAARGSADPAAQHHKVLKKSVKQAERIFSSVDPSTPYRVEKTVMFTFRACASPEEAAAEMRRSLSSGYAGVMGLDVPGLAVYSWGAARPFLAERLTREGLAVAAKTVDMAVAKAGRVTGEATAYLIFVHSVVEHLLEGRAARSTLQALGRKMGGVAFDNAITLGFPFFGAELCSGPDALVLHSERYHFADLGPRLNFLPGTVAAHLLREGVRSAYQLRGLRGSIHAVWAEFWGALMRHEGPTGVTRLLPRVLATILVRAVVNSAMDFDVRVNVVKRCQGAGKEVVRVELRRVAAAPPGAAGAARLRIRFPASEPAGLGSLLQGSAGTALHNFACALPEGDAAKAAVRVTRAGVVGAVEELVAYLEAGMLKGGTGERAPGYAILGALLTVLRSTCSVWMHTVRGAAARERLAAIHASAILRHALRLATLYVDVPVLPSINSTGWKNHRLDLTHVVPDPAAAAALTAESEAHHRLAMVKWHHFNRAGMSGVARRVRV